MVALIQYQEVLNTKSLTFLKLYLIPGLQISKKLKSHNGATSNIEQPIQPITQHFLPLLLSVFKKEILIFCLILKTLHQILQPTK